MQAIIQAHAAPTITRLHLYRILRQQQPSPAVRRVFAFW